MLITNIPKSVAVGTPTNLNRWLADEANQVIDEIQNLLDDTGQTKSASDLFQSSKAVARYVIGNTLVENSGSSTHNGSADIYVIERDGGDSKKIPATLLRGIFPVKIVNANQSNNVSLQLGTNTVKEWKKFDMAGNLTEIAVGELKAGDLVFAGYDTDVGEYILKKAFSDDGVKAISGKFNILNFLDFTASAPVAGGTIGDRYINTTGGTISAGTVDAAGTTVVANKVYELYDITGAYNWREIDPQNGNLVFNENNKLSYSYSGNSWNLNYSNVDKYSISGFVPVSGTTPDEQVTISTGKALCEDGFTLLNLTSIATDLDFPTLLGGALAADTTYHLFAFLKNDNTVAWDLGTSLTPTIATINSALAYRRIYSAKTDSSGDLPNLKGIDVGNGKVEYEFITGISETTSVNIWVPDATNDLTLNALPIGLKLKAKLNINATSVTAIEKYVYIGQQDLYGQKRVCGVGVNAEHQWANPYVFTNTLAQIKHGVSLALTTYSLFSIGYIDFRNYY